MTKKQERRKPVPQGKKKSEAEKKEKQFYLISILIVLAISFFAYLPVFHNEFTNWDDNNYITNNYFIRAINLKEIFKLELMGNYHPFTILVYAFEFHFFGLSPTGYYAVNLILHLLNVVLVARVAFLLSRKTIVAITVAMLFGLHPIHVESVAWASELKDLLYTFFFLGSYIYYLKYIDNARMRFYLFSLLLFLLSLLSKAMAVSLPVVLLLTDYLKGRGMNAKLLREKIPFFALALLFGIVAVRSQQSFGATESTIFPLLQRIVFASYSLIMYLEKIILPINLSAYYPYPIKPGASLPFLYYIFPALVVVLGFLLYRFRAQRKIFFGFAFFVTTVALVLQLLPVGDTIMADRYMYIPSIGLFYLAGEFFSRLSEKQSRTIVFSSLALIAVVFSIPTFSQCGIWRNAMALWTDVINKNENASSAYNNRGYLELEDKNFDAALKDFNKAIEIKSDYAHAYNNRGILFQKQNKMEEMLRDFNRAIEIQPEYFDALFNRGIVLSMQKKFDEAIIDFDRAEKVRNDNSDLYSNRGIAKYNSGKANDACNDFQRAARMGNQTAAKLLNDYCR